MFVAKEAFKRLTVIEKISQTSKNFFVKQSNQQIWITFKSFFDLNNVNLTYLWGVIKEFAIKIKYCFIQILLYQFAVKWHKRKSVDFGLKLLLIGKHPDIIKIY